MILAVDLGTNLGYAYRVSGLLISGSMNLLANKKAHSETRWLNFQKFLNDVPATAAIEVVAYEKPGVLFGHARKVLPGLQAIIELWAGQKGLDIVTCSPSELKKYATGDGKADKDMMRQSAELRWPGRRLSKHDEVDALFVLSFFEKKYARENRH